MGIFSFLSRDQDYEVVTPVQTVEKEAPPSAFPDLIKDLPIDIVDEDSQTLNSGVIVTVSRRELTMGRSPGALSFKVLEPGSAVFVRGNDNKMMQFFLKATVKESSRVQIKLKDLEAIVRENQRENFRLAMNVPISVYFYTDENLTRPENCTLVDISTGGCCFASEYLHGEGEVLRLKIKLEDYVAMNFVGEVIRVTECGPHDFRYGILFAQLKKDEVDTLTKTLFNLQMGNRKTHGRQVGGHW